MSYFEKYDEMFSEPSKAEQIIEDAKAALWNELTEEVKQLMDDSNEASTKANKLIAEISSLNFEKTELEKEIKQLREQKVYVETHEVPARQVKAIVNHLTKDIRPGDECWVIGAEYERHTRKCLLSLAGRRLKLTVPRAEATEQFQNQRISPKSQKSRKSGCYSASILTTT